MKNNAATLELQDLPQLATARQLWVDGKLDAALAQFEAALAAHPQNIKALIEAARAFGQRHEVAQAEELLARATDLAGNEAKVLLPIAQAYRVIYRPLAAVPMLQKLCHDRETSARAHLELALIYEITNQIDQAVAAARECVTQVPAAAEPKIVLARLERRAGNIDLAESILRSLTELRGAHPHLLMEAWGELSHLLDGRGDADGAIAAIEQSKAIISRLPQTRKFQLMAGNNNQLLGKVYQGLDQETLRRWSEIPFESDPRLGGIAQLIGFPRSGTTLLEQALGGHPGLIDAPEFVIFSRDIFPALYMAANPPTLTLETLNGFSTAALQTQRRRYVDYMEAALGESVNGRVLLDKNPSQTSLMVGLYRLWPESKFVVALRDPRDVLVSCYLRFFALSDFSVCFLQWETACKLYEFEMGIWLRMRELLPPDSWLELRYEDTVDDLPGQTQRAADFLGLEWTPEMLAYREKNPHKIVNSPTHEAVRKPIYRGAMGRWKKFEKHIGPYVERLRPLLDALGYS
ncbi:MAG: sulfotransferase [Pirellulales bacterium]|nr:sulfotransferase [Pirellulales bacterium]